MYSRALFIIVVCSIFCAPISPSAQSAAAEPKLEVGRQQGEFYWVVETAPDGTRRGGWVSVQVPLNRIDRNALTPLPPSGPVQVAPTPAIPTTDKPSTAPVPRAVPQSPSAVRRQGDGRMVFVTPTDDGFHVYVAAAITKKKVPVTVVSKPEMADFTLTAGQVEIKEESTGSKVVRCLFAYCAGAEDKGSTSVQLTDAAGIVRWSYAVNKGRGNKNRQSMAEAIAKHLKDEFFRN